VFERFSESARQVVVHAQEEARSLAHNYIGTEHILLGLLRQQDAVTEQVFASFGVTLDEVRSQVTRIVGQGDPAPTGQIPFTPRAKRVLELSLRHALASGSKEIGPRHIFLGLLDEPEGVAGQILSEAAPLEDFRQALGGTKLPRARAVPIAGKGARVLIVGWLLFGVSFGIGVLVGWAIWG
jgi:ATP-dependent Clp protease ATP-binding subunit ClpC